jgi:hypothetical protein
MKGYSTGRCLPLVLTVAHGYSHNICLGKEEYCKHFNKICIVELGFRIISWKQPT